MHFPIGLPLPFLRLFAGFAANSAAIGRTRPELAVEGVGGECFTLRGPPSCGQGEWVIKGGKGT